MRPVIAVTVDVESQPPHGRLFSKSYLNYSNAIWRCGGLPRLIAPITFAASTLAEGDPAFGAEVQAYLSQALNGVHGLIMPGGDDINPEVFGQAFRDSPRFVPVTKERLNFDREILSVAIAKKLPYLGVCYGAQLLALMSGGEIIQDIREEYRPGDGREVLRHECYDNGQDAVHGLDIEAGTIMARVFADGEAQINSKHHQAIASLGQNFFVSARAPDGIVEAIEAKDSEWFCLGVQWHPERAGRGAAGDGTVQALIHAAQNYANSVK